MLDFTLLRTGFRVLLACGLLLVISCGDGNSNALRLGELNPVPRATPATTIHLPTDIQDARFPWFTAPDDAIIFSATPLGATVDQLYAVRLDGSDLLCITCELTALGAALAQPLLKPISFRDDRRVIVRVGEQSPVVAADHAVLECDGPVRTCPQPVLVPIDIPAAGIATVIQDQREFRIAPDGQTVGFTQILEGPDGEAVFAAIVGRLNRGVDSYTIDDPRVVSNAGELKQFTPDGRRVLVAAFTTNPYAAANPDVLSIDLATGAQTRVTSDDDYEEAAEYAPDGLTLVVASGRTSGLFSTVSQIRRPNAIGPGLEPLAAALFTRYRPTLLRPWLVRAGETEGDDSDAELLDLGSKEEGFEARPIANWSSNGRWIVYSEDPIAGDPANNVSTRLRLVEIIPPAVGSAADSGSQGSASPSPASWATPLATFDALPPAPITSRPGRVSGAMTVVAGPSPADPLRHRLTVSFVDFSDEGASVIDGVEQADYLGGLVGSTAYTADITVSGEHSGYLRADATISFLGIDGEIESQLDDGPVLRLPAEEVER